MGSRSAAGIKPYRVHKDESFPRAGTYARFYLHPDCLRNWLRFGPPNSRDYVFDASPKPGYVPKKS